MTLSSPRGLHLNNLSEKSKFRDVYFCIYHKSIKLFSYFMYMYSTFVDHCTLKLQMHCHVMSGFSHKSNYCKFGSTL